MWAAESPVMPSFMISTSHEISRGLRGAGHVTRVEEKKNALMVFFFFCGAAAQRGPWPPHS